MVFNKEAKSGLWSFAIALLVLGFAFVIAAPTQVFNPTHPHNSTLIINATEDVKVTINITVNLTALASAVTENVSQVNITWAYGWLEFVPSTNLTSAQGLQANTLTFQNMSPNHISWNGSLAFPLMNGSSTAATFRFNSTAPTNPGRHNISVYVLNITGWSYYNLTLFIRDTTTPQLSINSTVSFDDGLNLSGTYRSFNISLSDAGNITNCNYTLNTWATNYTMTVDDALNIANASNSSMDDGYYTIMYDCRDVYDNKNVSTSFGFRQDSQGPNITVIGPPNDDHATTGTWSLMVNVTDYTVTNCTLNLDGVPAYVNNSVDITGATTITFRNDTATGLHSWNVSCTDAASNTLQTATRNFTRTSTSSDSSSGGGGASTTTSAWTQTYSYSSSELSTEGVVKELKAKERISIKVSGVIHHVGITRFEGSKVTINVSSTPQYATLGSGESAKFDINNDTSNYDIKVTVTSINSTSSKATITTMAINEPIAGTPAQPTTTDPNAPTAPEAEPEPEAVETGMKGSTIAWIVVLVLVIAGLIIWFVKKK